MTPSFTEAPILNSPYEKPNRHWELRNGIPTDNIVEQRRPSQYITPVPRLKVDACVCLLAPQVKLNKGIQGTPPT